jgi:hypothetical protein
MEKVAAGLHSTAAVVTDLVTETDLLTDLFCRGGWLFGFCGGFG